MILTTTPTVEGRTITDYKGVVFGEVISGVNFLRDFAASIRNIVGGHTAHFWGAVYGLLFPLVCRPDIFQHFLNQLGW